MEVSAVVVKARGGLWFTKTRCKREYAAKRIIRQDGIRWDSPAAAAKFLGDINPDTLRRWQGKDPKNPGKGCPYLGGAAIETRWLPGGMGRHFHYSSAKSLK